MSEADAEEGTCDLYSSPHAENKHLWAHSEPKCVNWTPQADAGRRDQIVHPIWCACRWLDEEGLSQGCNCQTGGFARCKATIFGLFRRLTL